MNLIEIQNLKKVYGNGENKVEALSDINLNVKEGELIAIVGRSGSGKSTLLNIIGTLDTQTEGEYLLDNNNLKNMGTKNFSKIRCNYFGFVVQQFALINDYTVYENIEIPLIYAKVGRKKRKELIDSITRKLGIYDKLYKTPKELSGGQNQRVAIARALVNDPKIILADEPTGALDSKTSQEIMNIMKELNGQGITIIIVTHDKSISSACNRVIEIKDGKIIKDYSTQNELAQRTN
ncbi:ABC transporter ATP-binding protein [Clostridium beijerinckii]|uniref:ABC transport system ATP-binding protein n=1 Tax=Clostridium beijerinckii TaxID=1520 RepID=A0AAX0AXT0_CLOBE|nr:ABC transporter ATP-binding protein [Clostridium beijerinckii]NRT71381.1 putative ABC transport system ATP-binding protein [Clostridium beijerinckii]NRT87887.1 putative ABC transport system ATP-binding protein [Clostridium beijerinckii]NYC73316.1 putative ABC transport system ATP-binding protein [Clostridium beijerinckii]